MIIDSHTHVFPDKIAEKTVSMLLKRINNENAKAFTNGTVDGLLQSMKESGTDYSITLPIVTNPAQFESINKFSASLNEIDGIIPFGSIHPDNDDVEEKLDFIKNSGLTGIKLHPDYQEVYIDDPRYIKIISYCKEIGLRVIIHAGVDVGLPYPVHCPPEKAVRMLEEISLSDDEKPFIVLAHMGGWKMQEDVKKYLCGKNVYFDTGYCLDSYSEQDLMHIINNHGTEKILFATDLPWGNQKNYIELLCSLPLTDDEKEKILGLNAKRFTL